MRRRRKQSPITYEQLKATCDRGKGTETESVEQQPASGAEADESREGSAQGLTETSEGDA